VSGFNIDEEFVKTIVIHKARNAGNFTINVIHAAFNPAAYSAEIFIEFQETIRICTLMTQLEEYGACQVSVLTFKNNDRSESASSALLRVWMSADKTECRYQRGTVSKELLDKTTAKYYNEIQSKMDEDNDKTLQHKSGNVNHNNGLLQTGCRVPVGIPPPRKETIIAGHLNQWSDEGKIPMYASWDKRVAGSNSAVCAIYRPDFVWETATHVVVLEVDEHQHSVSSYKPKCEFQRMCTLCGAFGMPMVMVRYNPDAFKLSGETCRTQQVNRLHLLLERVQHAIQTQPSSLIHVEYLFYSRMQQSTESPYIGRFSFSEQHCMSKWIDLIGTSWDSLTLAEAVEIAEESTSQDE